MLLYTMLASPGTALNVATIEQRIKAHMAASRNAALSLHSRCIYFDLEWNAADERSITQGFEGEPQEIVRLYAVVVDDLKPHQGATFETYVHHPRLTLSSHTRNITGITQEQMRSGLTVKDALTRLFQLSESGSLPFFSWGGDFPVIAKNMLLQCGELPDFDPKFYNLKDLFRLHKSNFSALGISRETPSGALAATLSLPGFKDQHTDKADRSSHNPSDDTLSLVAAIAHLVMQKKIFGPVVTLPEYRLAPLFI